MQPNKIASTTGRVVGMYSKYPYPFSGNHNDMFNRTVLPHILKLGGISTVLEAGCGTGNVALDISLSLPEAQITAVDLTDESLAVARKNADALNIRNVTFRKSNLLEYDVNLGVFDFVHCQGVLHHLADPALGLENLGRYLKSGKYAYVWIYTLLGRRDVLEIQEIIKTLGGDAMSFEQRMQLLETILKYYKPTAGAAYRKHLCKPLNSRLLEKTANALKLLNETGWRYFFSILSLKLKRASRHDQAAATASKAGKADNYLHPHEVFYRLDEAFALFLHAGFEVAGVINGMSSTLEESLGAGNEISKLASGLSIESKFKLIELYERPSGVGFLLRKR